MFKDFLMEIGTTFLCQLHCDAPCGGSPRGRDPWVVVCESTKENLTSTKLWASFSQKFLREKALAFRVGC